MFGDNDVLSVAAADSSVVEIDIADVKRLGKSGSTSDDKTDCRDRNRDEKHF